MGKLSVIIGAQWGDEGKGKWVDQIAKDLDIVCRFQGGNNAGHTIYVKGNKHVLHLLPNGVFHAHTKIALSSGVVIDPTVLLREMEEVSTYIDIPTERLWISSHCHVITPWHIHLDSKGEEHLATRIGTTKRGIGPTYADRALRRGLTMSNFVNGGKRKLWIEEYKETNEAFRAFHMRHLEEWTSFEHAAERLAPYVCEAEYKVRRALAEGKNILCEGAQGALLDLAHGTYPYVTANSTHPAQAAVSLGIDPRAIDKIYGVAKVYATRVGEGPFPTELFDDVGRTLLEKGKEYGSTTKRPRRCGWFDAVAMRYVQDMNGLDGVFFSKLDILTGFEEVKICTAYKHPRLGLLDYFPSNTDVVSECTPVYETFPGWKSEIPKFGVRNDLPTEAKDFLDAIEKLSGCKIVQLGTGPDRDSYINCSDIF